MSSVASVLPFVAIVVLCGALIVAQTVLRFVYGYALTPSRFEVRLFDRVPVLSFPLEEMVRASMWRFSPQMLLRSFVP